MRRRLILGFITALLAANATAASPQPASPAATSVQAVRAEVGVFNPPGSGKPAFVPTRQVPLVAGQMYGWIIAVQTDKPKVKWREEMTLPANPALWNVNAKDFQRLDDKGRTSVIERDVAPENGLIYNSWGVVAGDPAGRYRIRVFIENELAANFEFELLAPGQQAK